MKKLFLVIIIGGILLFGGCKKLEQPMSAQTEIVLGTVCTVNLFEHGTQELYAEIFNALHDVENLMSANSTTSELVLVNNNAGISSVQISEETYTVIEAALKYAKMTNGAFNPAIGPLVKLWAIGTDSAAIPSGVEIERTSKLCNWQNVLLSQKKDGYFVFLEKEGMALDLGGVAKGFAADKTVAILQGHAIPTAMIDLGGNIYACGEKLSDVPWRIGIKNPFDSTGEPIVALSVHDASVVTSGVYERFFEQDGVRYHHLINTATGRPQDNELMSVTIVAKSSMQADILSTAVFILGKEAGLKLLEQINISGFCITRNKEIYATENSALKIEVFDKNFTLNL